MSTRVEKDSMGDFEVPASAYYGATTMRAVQNFPISDLRFDKRFISALALIKQQAAAVNCDLGLLDEKLTRAIVTACQEILDGNLDEWFVLDIFQTGSGTSTNMNANEVISNRAIEILGGTIGSRTPVHPNDHVNLCQSSNDVIPTAIHVAAACAIQDELLPALQQLETTLRDKSKEFWPLIKTGRTHLQDATPIRLGQEFLGWAGQVQRSITRCQAAIKELSELALGGTAVGTGVAAHSEFAPRVVANLAEITKVSFVETDNHFQAQGSLDNVVAVSGCMKTVATSLYKIACDLRLLGCGPRAGIAELNLPAVQPGSSIMPGKVNPVIAEFLTMVVAQVYGNDSTITFSGAAGSFLELNVMMPVVAYNLLQAISLLTKASVNFASQCVVGITATENGPALVERGLMTCTGLAPRIGYDAAAAIAKEAYATGRTVREVAREKTSLSEEELTDLLDPEKMTVPGRTEGAPSGG